LINESYWVVFNIFLAKCLVLKRTKEILNEKPDIGGISLSWKRMRRA